MDHSRFDNITRTLAAPSRRSLLGLAGASALTAVLGRSEAEAKKKKCKKPKIKCGKACVNPKTSPNHCGGCGKRCEGDLTCINGQCACADTTRTKCGTACVNLQTDEQNCGVCGEICGGGQTCVSGDCVGATCNQACTGGQHCCDPFGSGTPGCWNCCDDQHCVANEVFNARGQVVCRIGGCNCPDDQPALCPAGFGSPAQRCTDPRSDKRNCHPDRFTCGPGCPNHPDHECCDGTCVFLPKCLNNTGGWQECQTPHCGVCGSPCDDEGFGCCNGSCVDMTQDPNCGSCGADCSSIGEVCEGGACHECECEEEGGD